MNSISCIVCGGNSKEKTGSLVVFDNFVGKFIIENSRYLQCDNCHELLIPEKTSLAIDRERENKKLQLLCKLPISDYIDGRSTARILGVSRQALHKNKAIKSGKIYHIKMGKKKIYNKRSVQMYLDTSDGRYPLENTPYNVLTIIPYEQIDNARYIDLGLWSEEIASSRIPYNVIKQSLIRGNYNVQ